MTATLNNNPGNSGAIQGTFTFGEFTNLVEKTFVEKLANTPIDAQQLFQSYNMGLGEGDVKQMNEKDFSTYAKSMPEGVDAQKGLTGVGYHKQINWYRYGFEYDVTFKMRTTAKWVDIIADTVNALIQAVPQRMNLDRTHRITFGNATTYVDMDGFTRDLTTGTGQPLFEAAHTLAFSANTYSNIVPGNPQFSKSALEAAEQLTISNIVDNFGVQKRMNFDTIWCAETPTLINDIQQYLRSTADPVQANSGVMNPYKGKYSILPLSLLASDANGIYNSAKRLWWGLAALNGVGAGRWQAWEVVWENPRMKTMPREGNNGEDVHNDNWTYGSRGACNWGVLSARGMIGSLPTA